MQKHHNKEERVNREVRILEIIKTKMSKREAIKWKEMKKEKIKEDQERRRGEGNN